MPFNHFQNKMVIYNPYVMYNIYYDRHKYAHENKSLSKPFWHQTGIHIITQLITCVFFLPQTRSPPDPITQFAKGYEDYLQSPLQV